MDAEAKSPAYSKDFLLKLYKVMALTRACEESFVEPILKREIFCPVHLYSGEEAVAAGVCANLDKTDVVFGSHRSHGHFLAKGGDLRELVAEVYCRQAGCSRGRGGSMHLIAPEAGFLGAVPIVGGTISLALGAALAARNKGEKAVAAAFFGDGACGEGALYESLNFAAVQKLPLLFVCENNFYSTHMPILEIRTSKRIYDSVSKLGVPAKRVDGNDVLKVYEAAKEAVAACRAGEGPRFLELLTYRQRGHVGPDDNIQGVHYDIRPKAEIRRWRAKDPLARFRRKLLRDGVAEQELRALDEEAETSVKAAHEWARALPKPPAEELGDYVFK